MSFSTPLSSPYLGRGIQPMPPIPFPSLDDHQLEADAPSQAPQPSTPPSTPPRIAVPTPERRYPAKVQGGHIIFPITPDTKSKLKTMKQEGDQGVLYSIKIERTDGSCGRYFGTSGQPLGRFAHHGTQFTHADEKSRRLFVDGKANPGGLSIGIVETLELEKLADAETAAIVKAREAAAEATVRKAEKVDEVFNQRLGGGGGQVQTKAAKESPFTVSEIVAMIKKSYQSPESKKFGEHVESRKGAIYDIFFDETTRVHHIGFTTRDVRKRIQEHFCGIRHPDKPYGQTIPFFEKARANLENVRVRVFDVSSYLQQKISPADIECAFMQFFDQRGETVENIGNGGKGSFSRTTKLNS
jgi:hypothetical protein